MSANEPPRIRDERRNPDLTRLKERVAVLDARQDKTEQLVSGMHYALFGIPEDRNSNGLVGEMHYIKTSMQSANNKLVALLIAALCALGGAILDIVTRHA